MLVASIVNGNYSATDMSLFDIPLHPLLPGTLNLSSIFHMRKQNRTDVVKNELSFTSQPQIDLNGVMKVAIETNIFSESKDVTLKLKAFFFFFLLR